MSGDSVCELHDGVQAQRPLWSFSRRRLSAFLGRVLSHATNSRLRRRLSSEDLPCAATDLWTGRHTPCADRRSGLYTSTPTVRQPADFSLSSAAVFTVGFQSRGETSQTRRQFDSV